MADSSPSALITDQGAFVEFRLDGRFYRLSQQALRQLLGLPDGPRGLGITIDRDRLEFEFARDDRSVTLTASQLRCRLAKRVGAKV